MSHCAPEATLKPKRFEFTLKTVITDVAQVYWEAVPKMWPGGSEASVAKCVVRPWNSTRSVGGRVESTSWTFRNQVYVVSQVRRCLAGQRRLTFLSHSLSFSHVPKQLHIHSTHVRNVIHRSYMHKIFN